MKFKMLFTCSLLLLLGITVGCIEKTESLVDNSSVESTPNADIPNKKVKSAEVLEVSENTLTPAEAVTQQFKVNFEDGSHLFPKKEDLVFETILGENAITTFRSPEGENHYATFIYTRDHNWTMNGLMRFFVDESSTLDSKGLKLPMDDFSVQYLQIPEDSLSREVWAFYDEKHVITVSRMDAYSFSNPSDTTEISLENGNEAFVVSNSKESFVFYYDTDKLIIVSGNIEASKLVELTNSLPPADSADFPSSESGKIENL
ncbi:hypothetical protein [Exiguobacterium sp. KJ 601]|uniref:hypothetical protein n=1 Tax=Exiguobacterium sp. KJ 601 TaxID=2782569 RepID=UPI0022AF390F|nr:hypothetical protein [Exiguobacterium sp. KJ 601]